MLTLERELVRPGLGGEVNDRAADTGDHRAPWLLPDGLDAAAPAPAGDSDLVRVLKGLVPRNRTDRGVLVEQHQILTGDLQAPAAVDGRQLDLVPQMGGAGESRIAGGLGDHIGDRAGKPSLHGEAEAALPAPVG